MTTALLTLNDYWRKVASQQAKYPSLRHGQTAFNVLYDLRPDLSEQLRGTSLDPFHLDDRMPAFREWLGENW